MFCFIHKQNLINILSNTQLKLCSKFSVLHESRPDVKNCNTTTSPPPRSLALNLSAQSFIHIWSSGSISGSGQSVPARADSWGENSFIFNISVIKKQCVRMAVSFWEEMHVLVSSRQRAFVVLESLK